MGRTHSLSQGNQVVLTKLHHHPHAGLVSTKDSPVVFNPYATLWAEGNYYLIGKEVGEEDLIHLRIDRIRDIEILEQAVEMVFGGINPSQYAEKYIYNKGELIGNFDLECDKDLWEDLVDTFGEQVRFLGLNTSKIHVRVKAIPTVMKNWVLVHCGDCEVIAPQVFRDQIQTSILKAYEKYW